MTANQPLQNQAQERRSLRRVIERRFWYQWFLLVGVAVITTVGLATAMRPLMIGKETPWPWMPTEYVLLVGISILVTAFAAYLTQQQRKTEQLRKRYERLQEQVAERMQRQYSRVLALFDFSHVLDAGRPTRHVFEDLVNLCMQTFGCQKAALLVLDEATGELETVAANGYGELAETMKAQRHRGQGLAGWVAEKNKPLLVELPVDSDRYPGLEVIDRSITAAMVAPITVGTELIGVIEVSSRSIDTRFDQDDLNTLCLFAENVGTYIQFADSLEQVHAENTRLREALATAKAASGLPIT